MASARRAAPVPCSPRAWRGGAAAALAVIAISAGLAACGGSPSGAAVPGRPVGVLPAGAIAGLPAVTTQLTAAAVQKTAGQAGLAARLRGWGYTGGWQRTFQGESRRLTLVVSRSLTFTTRAGATAFVSYLDQHVGAFYPYALSRPLTLPGQAGWLIRPPMCACHMAEPLVVGVTAAGRLVRWMEINGPRATARVLSRLLAER